MARIAPLSMNDLPAGLAEDINEAMASQVISSSVPLRVWGRRPDIARTWLATLSAFYKNSLISDRLRELIRLKIASITQCKACQIARKSDSVAEEELACLSSDSDYFTDAEQAALQFVERFGNDYTSLNDENFASLRVHYSEDQIVEINLFAAMMLAGGRATYVLNAYEEGL